LTLLNYTVACYGENGAIGSAPRYRSATAQIRFAVNELVICQFEWQNKHIWSWYIDVLL